MKRVVGSAFAIGTALLMLSCTTKNAAQMSESPVYGAALTGAGSVSDPWPLEFISGTNTYTIFAPQCDSWDGHQLVGRSAVAVQAYGQAQPAYGVLEFGAITLVDKTRRLATLADVKVTGVDFPSERGHEQNYVETLRQVFPERAPTLSLDRVESSLTAAGPPPATEKLNNTPPKIIIANRPAVLVSLDGPPVWRPVPGTMLERAINTRMFLLKDQSGRFYLHVFDGYLQADSFDGHWMVAIRPPDGAAAAEQRALDSGQVDLMQGTPDPVTHKEPSLRTSAVPDVFVATTPSELINFSGLPEYASIPGTDLLFADNTSGNVFKLLTDQQNYILISGRWYRAPSLNGPWQFVPGNQLPRDFANIPDTSPKENVKASVPGTMQAEEALIANSVPQSTAVARTEQMRNPQVDGAMQLVPIAGTPLHYVVNSSTPIIEVDPQSWYACQDGVWYTSSSASGPWVVAASVPAVIYTIPTSSPLHYLTYVQVYGSTPDVVYEGYTPGYLGTEVGDDGTVVYGTGYDYAPWIGSVWYGAPVTWGCGFDDCWTPWWGWGFDCGFGWGCGYPGFGWCGCYPPFPWWGGYCGYHDYHHGGWRDGHHGDFANTGTDFYHDGEQFGETLSDGHGGRFGENDFDVAGSRDHGGWSSDYGRAYNSRTGHLAAGQWARVQRVSGSAWDPARSSALAQASPFAGRGEASDLSGRERANSNTSLGQSPQINPAGTRVWSAPAQHWNDMARSANASRSYPVRPRPFSSPELSGMGRNFAGSSYRGWGGGGSSPAGPATGGWTHSIGNFFHGGGGGFRSSGGFGGGGGFRGGGGGWGGGGHGGGGGAHR